MSKLSFKDLDFKETIAVDELVLGSECGLWKGLLCSTAVAVCGGLAFTTGPLTAAHCLIGYGLGGCIECLPDDILQALNIDLNDANQPNYII